METKRVRNLITRCFGVVLKCDKPQLMNNLSNTINNKNRHSKNNKK